MDPDEALAYLRKAADDYEEASTISMASDASDRLVNGFRDLDQWLRNGGFPPADWTSNGVQAS